MTSRRNDPLSIDTLRMRVSMMSDESLREFAQRRDTEGAVARRELQRRDDEVTFAE